MLFTNRSSDLPQLERVIDYTPLVVAPEMMGIAAIALMHDSHRHPVGDSILTASIQPTAERHHYSYVLVVAASRPIGILTQRDVIGLVATGKNLAAVTISEVMTAPVITSERAALTDVLTTLSFMQQHCIGHLPIVDECGLLAGMVTAAELSQCYKRIPEQVVGRSQRDRQRAAALFQSQQDLSDFVENAIVCLHWVAADGTIIWANQAELDLLGYQSTEYIGHSITEFHADQTAIADILDRLLQDRPVREYEADLRCKDGSIRHVLIDSNSSWRNGEFIRTRCFTRDITERKQAEAALIHSEQKFRAIFDSMFQFIGLLTPDGILIEGNQTAFNAIAVDRVDVIGKPFWETPWWHTPHLQEQVKQAVATAAQGELVRFESEHRWADGQTVFIDFSLKPVFDAAGQVVMLIPEGRDITDRKHKEDILRNIALGVSAKTGEAFFEALVEYLTKALRVEYAFIGELVQPTRDRVRTLAGYGDGSKIDCGEYALVGTPCQRSIDLQFYVCPDRLQQHFPQDVFLSEIGAQSYMGLLLTDSTGQALGLISVMSCQPFSETQLMTEILNIFAARAAAELERQQSEIELRNQKQDLARSNEELQQFASVASHDLQEPLRMITSYVELLERRYKGQLDDKADLFIAYAVDGASRMQTLINDLLNYSRVGRQDRDCEAVDCEQILRQVLTDFQVTIAQNQAIVTHVPLPQVYGDRSQLTQLFQNLIGNAIKFRSQAPPQIEISVTTTEGKWLFSVQDNGIGMENEYLERIFIIFQRLHGKTEYPGTGIGLAVCKKIIERHGGNLWVDSQPNRGSTFYFTLPSVPGNLC